MDNQDDTINEELEEGEVSNDSDNGYTPLERPANYSNFQTDHRSFQTTVTQDSLSEDELGSDLNTDSDSSDEKKKSKKPKIKLKPLPKKTQTQNKKYDVWSTRVQEDVLSETLNSCDVTRKDRSRDIESYDYTLSAKYQDQMNNKRTRDDRKNIHLRLGKRNDSDQKKMKGKSRNIADLETTLENTVEEIAQDMANKLYEEKEDLIMHVLNIVGKQKCFDIYQETKKVEADGGLLIMNQTRRRTPGGVFFYLVRCDEGITIQQKREMFSDDNRKQIKERKKKKLQELKRKTAEERAKLLPELLTRAEQLIENRLLKEVKEADVLNPPPTPETDGHDNSCDGVESMMTSKSKLESTDRRNTLTSYDDDFLDIGCTNNEMDLF